MPNWSGGVLTTKGQALQAKVDAGKTLIITKMKIGSGVLPDGQNIQSLGDLIAPQKNIPVSGISATGNVTTITGVITNTGLTTGFYVRELGIFAQDPDAGEILYSVTTDSAPDYLPSEGGAVTVSSEFSYNIVVSNAANVTATINQNGLVTISILNEKITEHNNDPNAHNLLTALHLWQPRHQYTLGDICYSNTAASYKYFECITAGISGATEPIWPAVGKSITDGTVAWIVRSVKDADTVDGKNAIDFAPSGCGVGESVVLQNVDISNYRSSGFFYAYPSCQHLPSENYYKISINGNGGAAVQVATNIETNISFVRSYFNSTWSSWEKIITANQISKATYVNSIDTRSLYLGGDYFLGPDCINKPPEDYCLLNVISSTNDISGVITQVATSQNGKMYLQAHSPGSGSIWIGWREIATMDQVAPSGYGLGGSIPLKFADANDYRSTGDFYFTTGCSNVPEEYFNVHVSGNGNDAYQIGMGVVSGITYTRTSNSKIWTPWKQIATANQLDAGHLFASNGWQKLNGGLILQWGSLITTAGETPTTVNFPISFTNICFSVMASPVNYQPNVTGFERITAVGAFYWNTANFQIASQLTAGRSCTWLAIGY